MNSFLYQQTTKTSTPISRRGKCNDVDGANLTGGETEEGDIDKLVLSRSTLKAERYVVCLLLYENNIRNHVLN